MSKWPYNWWIVIWFSRGKVEVNLLSIKMKATLLKNSRSKQVMNRLELSALAEMIRKNPNEKQVYHLRQNLTSADESRYFSTTC